MIGMNGYYCSRPQQVDALLGNVIKTVGQMPFNIGATPYCNTYATVGLNRMSAIATESI